jgi:DNA-binding beta-propeller fold protein YncE
MKLKLILTTAVVSTAAALLGSVAPASGAPFVYVTNVLSSNVSQYNAAGGALAPLSPATVATGNQPIGVAVSPDSKNVYVTTNFPVATILQYAVGPDGTLTLKSSATVPVGALPGSLAVSPNGQSMYVINDGPAELLQYSVQADGSLTPKSPLTVPTGPGPDNLAVSPDSRSVYVVNTVSGLSTVSQYTAAADGTLTPKSPPTVPTGSTQSAEPFGIAVSPDGKSVYVADVEAEFDLNGSVFQYTVGADGTLNPKSPPRVPVSGHPLFVAVSPDGKNVYVTANSPAAVLHFSVGTDGALTPRSSAVATGSGVSALAITSDGKSVYVISGSNTVSQYSVSADGTLAPRSPATVAAGSDPSQIAVTPVAGVPTHKEQCKNDGWRDFPQFKNQGLCLAFVNRT